MSDAATQPVVGSLSTGGHPTNPFPIAFQPSPEASPNQLAVYDHQTSLTYAELDQAANQVANAILAERGPGQEVVALLVGIDAPAVTAALGILKAGKTYVALEASFPQKRSLHILADADVKLILADGPHLPQARELAGSERQVIELEGLATCDPQPPNVPVPLNTLAVLNYTSGSTGQPKGVVQSHLSAFVQAVRRYSFYRVGDADRVAFFGSLAWTASVWSVFGPLCLGASVGRFDFRQHGLDQLANWLLETEPTVLCGRMVIRQLVHSNPRQRFASVRLVTLGGDTIFRDDVQASMLACPNALIAVGLGLSEAGRVTELLLDSPAMLNWDVATPGFSGTRAADQDRVGGGSRGGSR